MYEDAYKKEGGEDLNIEQVLRNSFVDFMLINDDQCIPEFFIEIHGRYINLRKIKVKFPAIIGAFCLPYLCYSKMGRHRERDDSLYLLTLLVRYAA